MLLHRLDRFGIGQVGEVANRHAALQSLWSAAQTRESWIEISCI
jgi:hypothetical protein